jgi:carbon storage regulator CsrA
MLLLTMSPNGGKVIISGDNFENIELSVLSVKGDLVRVGFNAAKNIAINRERIYYAKQADAANSKLVEAEKVAG